MVNTFQLAFWVTLQAVSGLKSVNDGLQTTAERNEPDFRCDPSSLEMAV